MGKVRINPNGIFGVASASLVEKHEVEEEVPVEMEVDGEKKEDAGEKKEGGEEKMEGDEKKEETAKEGGEDKMETEEPKKEEKKEVKMEKRKKTVNKTIELPVSSRVQGQLSFDKLQAATTSENALGTKVNDVV